MLAELLEAIELDRETVVAVLDEDPEVTEADDTAELEEVEAAVVARGQSE